MRLAFVFPGQGSQSVGMLAEYAGHPSIRKTVDEASSILGQDLGTLMESGPEADLNLTANTQPVMLAADIAVYRAWLEIGGRPPEIMAGHSLGEYAALVAAGVMRFADALRVVRARGEAMQAAVAPDAGGIAAILGLDADAVMAACREAAQGDVVAPANLNAPGQIVISGARAAVERAIEACKRLGAKRGVLLPMSVPAHCALMLPAAETLRSHLAGVSLSIPAVPVVNNVDVATVSTPADIRDALARQLSSPVRWVETVQSLEAHHGVTHILECGPGKVLQGLNRRIVDKAACLTLSSFQSILESVAVLKTGETT